VVSDCGSGTEPLTSGDQHWRFFLRRDALHRGDSSRRAGKAKIHLMDVDRVSAHALEHPSAVGSLFKTSGWCLIVQEIREKGTAVHRRDIDLSASGIDRIAGMVRNLL